MTDLITSRAHDWVGLLPQSYGVKCIRCGLKVTTDEMAQGPRCVAHYENIESGYFDESGEHDAH